MEVIKSLEFLRQYVYDRIDTRPAHQDEAENGVRAMMNVVQQDYKFDLGLRDNVGGKKLTSLKDACKVAYPNDREWIEEFADRDYVSDVILGDNIDTEEYVDAIRHYIAKWKEDDGEMTFTDGYEATHWVWGLYEISKDNHILRNYQKLMADCLLMLYNTFPASDLKTECVYFLTLVDVSRVKEEMIMKLEQQQLPDGRFYSELPHSEKIEKSQERTYEVHHICLALLAIYNWYHKIREN
jgi:hypothetical protein